MTGPIGCGKSTVAGWLGERPGVVVIDADQVAREVVEPGEPALDAVVARFGPGVLRDDGSLDRAALGRIVFADPAALRDLEAITHPAVRPRILAAIADAEAAEAPGRRHRGDPAGGGRPRRDLRRGLARDLRSDRPAGTPRRPRRVVGRRGTPDRRAGRVHRPRPADRHARHRQLRRPDGDAGPRRRGVRGGRLAGQNACSVRARTGRLDRSCPTSSSSPRSSPPGDQPAAIERLSAGLAKGVHHQTLLGATGTGKTATLAWTIANHNKPTLVLAHNKTLAAQLYAEFREFFPENAVEYFVSYFDYYQPEAYLPRSDTYIEKDSSRNDEIDRLRHAATHALFERRDVIIVASVSCIYGLGAPVDYGATVLKLRVGGQYRRDAVLRHLVDLQYQRNDAALARARFRVRGDTLELQPASEETLIRIEFFGDEVERITELDPLTGELLAERKEVNVYPATHYVTPQDKLKEAIVDIEAEMEERVGGLEAEGRALEGARLRQRTTFDLEMMRELGYCTGIENYSRHLSRREPGSRPWTLLDYFPPDWLLVVDESHMTIPQVVGMYKNDRTRKEILVDFGFRLPSALDNRPLTFEEFEATVHQAIYMSATPGPYELERSKTVVQQLIRPTGVVDPTITVRPTEGQIDDLLEEIRARVERGERALVTTLTKKMAEDLADYLKELGVKVQYLHSEVDTLERVAILRDLRLGVFDVLVGINLLREGIDLPEVTLVAILDADKEGFLRSAWSLIQMIGRAARNIGGEVIMYADTVTESMRVAIDETDRRRAIQVAYNTAHGIEPTTIVKGIRDLNERLRAVAESTIVYASERGGDVHRRGPGQGRGRRRADGGRDEGGRQAARVRAGRRAARRDPADPAARAPGGRLDHRRTGGGAGAAGMRRMGAGCPARPIGRGVGGARPRRWRRDPSWRSRASRSCRPTRSRRRTSTASRATAMRPGSTRTRSPTGCPASATSTRTPRAGRPAGSTVRPGIARSRRTSGSAPASARDAAADDGRVRTSVDRRRDLDRGRRAARPGEGRLAQGGSPLADGCPPAGGVGDAAGAPQPSRPTRRAASTTGPRRSRIVDRA